MSIPESHTFFGRTWFDSVGLKLETNNIFSCLALRQGYQVIKLKFPHTCTAAVSHYRDRQRQIFFRQVGVFISL